MKLSGNTILVTGGGSGIGGALAHRLHDVGNTVIITGRRQDTLDRAAEGRENIVPLTLNIDDAEAIRAFAGRVTSDYPQLNVLFNNAGIMRYEALGRARDLADAEATITTNLLGPIRMVDAFVEHLVSRPDAAIINNASGLAFVPLVPNPTYSATKAALHSYTVSLREALRGRIDVIELAPPAVQTALIPGQESREGYQPLADFADEVIRCSASNRHRPRSWCSGSASFGSPSRKGASTRRCSASMPADAARVGVREHDRSR